ncbi:MAG: hypothetical protein ACRD2L_10025, partial [Terriglobia bacterium]
MVSVSPSPNKVITSLPPGKEHIAQEAALVKQNKEAAKHCLLLADRFIKEGDFEKARVEVERAQKLDPTHPYITAFLDRISYFEDEKKKNAPKVEPPATKEAVPPKVEPPKTGVPAPVSQPSPPGMAATPKPVEAAKAPPTSSPPPAKKPIDAAKILESFKNMPVSQSTPKSALTGSPPKGELDDMRKQIEDLSRALLEEKKAREEIREHQLQGAVNQLRGAMEKVWLNGAPKDAEALACHQLALSLNIPPEVEQSVRREVKIDMYSRAVKEVISKRKLLRNSSSTLEWLRKVYQITVTEYLENESKFLLDLVADQYRG